jgi:Zn-dependent protease with chaperone function
MVSRVNLRAASILLAILFAVPLLGYGTSLYVASDYESQFKQALVPEKMTESEYQERGISYMKLCAPAGVLRNGQSDICQYADLVQEVRWASGLTALLGFLVLAIIFCAKFVAGTNRRRLVLVFGPTVRAVMIILAISTLAQAGLFIYSIFTLESSILHRVHFIALAVIGLVALAVCGQLLSTAASFFRSRPMRARAQELQREENPSLFALVESTARRLGTQIPDHIIAGLEPNFFVTASDVLLVGSDSKVLRGRTLFVSLSLMRLLKRDEFTAVIGHELGHFRGEDTAYSMKFAPIYSRLTDALQGLQADDTGYGALARLPALATLSFCLTEFAKAERMAGRAREFLADKAGAEVSSAEALANALVKLTVFSGSWELLIKANIESLAEGRFFTELPAIFRQGCEAVYAELDWTAVGSAFDQYLQAHPIDTHPPVSQRLEALGFKGSEIAQTAARPAEEPAISLITNVQKVDEAMSSLEAQYLVAIGAAKAPAASEQSSAAAESAGVAGA